MNTDAKELNNENIKSITGDITPLPWKIESYNKTVVDETGNKIAYLSGYAPNFNEDCKNTEYIVKACNLFPELVEALEEYIQIVISNRIEAAITYGWDKEEAIAMVVKDPEISKANSLINKAKQ